MKKSLIITAISILFAVILQSCASSKDTVIEKKRSQILVKGIIINVDAEESSVTMDVTGDGKSDYHFNYIRASTIFHVGDSAIGIFDGSSPQWATHLIPDKNYIR